MKRFKALDVFRGLTICLMIIVNTPGDWNFTFSPLLHANWHGFTQTDLVFPSFLFEVGNAFAFVRTSWAGTHLSEVFQKIIKRTLIIFLLGYLMYWFPFVKVDTMNNISSFPIGETRILGVLQRIALCYLAASLIIWYLKPKITLIIGVILLLGYWVLLYAFGDVGQELTLTGNAALKLDLWLMGENHLYHGEGVAFDYSKGTSYWIFYGVVAVYYNDWLVVLFYEGVGWSWRNIQDCEVYDIGAGLA